MAREVVKCTGRSAASAAAVWAFVADFARLWHPDVARMQPETGAGGTTLRRFWVRGEDTPYLEQLTYLSHSDRVMSYRALEGISGAISYDATLSIHANSDGGCSIIWQAEIEATAARIADIASGTRHVFEAGLAVLADISDTVPASGYSLDEPVKLQKRRLGNKRRLGITVAPAGLKRADLICIFLHGIGGQRGNWDAQLGQIGARIPAISLDLRGYGDSSLGEKATTMEAYCKDILAVAKEFSAQKIILIGLSYGSWIATSFAMRHADRLAGLVLAGGCTGMSEAPKSERDAFRTSREVPLDAGKTPADFAPAVVDIIAGPKATAAQRRALFSSMAAIPGKTYRDALTCFTNPTEVFDFAKISCPVLMMTGTYDRLAPVSEIRQVSQRIHNAALDVQFEEIFDAGHVCNLEQPAQFNGHLTQFIRRFETDGLMAELSGKELRRRAKHRRILDAALGEFAKNGFSGASMQAIAKRAGVSKPTLYQYFGQKETLLAAVLDAGKSELLAPFQDVKDTPMVEVLWQFSWTYADFVLGAEMMSLARLIIGEAERLPDVAREYQEAGPLKALAGIMAFLEVQKNAGNLQFEDAELTAQSLWSLILSAPRERLLHHPTEQPNHQELARYISNGLRVFLKAFSTHVVEDIAALNAIILTELTPN